MSVRKRIFSIIFSLVTVISFIGASNTQVFAAEPTEQEVAVEVMAEDIEVSDGVEILSYEETEDEFMLVARVTPRVGEFCPENPTGLMAGEDGQTVTNIGTFSFVVPSGKTLNRLYLNGVNTSGYVTTATVSGFGNYSAVLNGTWYRVSNNNLNRRAGTHITCVVSLADTVHPYNIAILGRQ